MRYAQGRKRRWIHAGLCQPDLELAATQTGVNQNPGRG
jgi:hypothetical protein